jgi:hypothetical protein
MAVGFPVKADYATGDVLTAANMNDLAGTLNTVITPLGNAAGKNKIINGDFGIWQRGTTFNVSTTGTFLADRFVTAFNGSGSTRTITQQTFTAGTAPVSGYESQFFLRYDQSVAGTGATFSNIGQRIEDVRAFAGQTVTISFYAKAAATTTVGVGFTQNFGGGGSASVSNDVPTAFSVSTSWARYSYTLNIASISGKTIGTNSFLLSNIQLPLNSTFTLDIWGFQVEAGSIATPFQTATGTIQGELAACKRYLPSVTSYDNVIGYSYVTNNALYYFAFDVQARVAPTGVTATSASAFALNTPTTVTPTFQSAGVNGGSLNAAFTITAGQGSRIGGGSILFTGCEL